MGEKTILLYSYVQLNENRYAGKSIRLLKPRRGIVDQQADVLRINHAATSRNVHVGTSTILVCKGGDVEIP